MAPSVKICTHEDKHVSIFGSKRTQCSWGKHFISRCYTLFILKWCQKWCQKQWQKLTLRSRRKGFCYWLLSRAIIPKENRVNNSLILRTRNENIQEMLRLKCLLSSLRKLKDIQETFRNSRHNSLVCYRSEKAYYKCNMKYYTLGLSRNSSHLESSV